MVEPLRQCMLLHVLWDHLLDIEVVMIQPRRWLHVPSQRERHLRTSWHMVALSFFVVGNAYNQKCNVLIRLHPKYPHSVSNCWVWHFTRHHTSECLLQTGQLINSCCQFLVLCLKVCPTNPHLVRWSMPNGLTLRHVGEIAMTSASKSAKEKDPSFFLQGWTGDISSSKSARLFSDFEGSW